MTLQFGKLGAACAAAMFFVLGGCASEHPLQARSICSDESYVSARAAEFQENRFDAQQGSDHLQPAMTQIQNLYVIEAQRSPEPVASERDLCRQYVRRAQAGSRRDLSRELQDAVAQR